MERIWTLFLVFILIFSITACGMNTSEKPTMVETMAINAVEQHWFHVPIVRLPAVVCVTVVTEPAYVSIVMGQDAGSVIIRVV